MDPNGLKGTKTGVVIGTQGSDSMALQIKEALKTGETGHEGYLLTGHSGNMLSNRLSFFYNLKGN